MKKIFTLSSLLLLVLSLWSQQANLFTIPNQSAQFIRMPARETAIDVDAVFFNPANLPSLGNGVFLNINNQILNQTSNIQSDYQLYPNGPNDYPGKVRSFIFPSVFANWNINKSSFHGGFLIVGGAGGVNYTNLPVSDRGIADVPAAITNSDFFSAPSLVNYDAANGTSFSQIADYRFNFINKGLGFSPGVQLGYAYKLNDYFSFGMDFRWMQQVFSSEGEVSNIEILPNTTDPSLNNWISPGDYLRLVGAETGNTVYTNIAGIYDGLAEDRYINIRQKGSGITFIPSVLINPTKRFFIALKYEHKAKVVLTTKVRDGKDGGVQNGRPVFIDGEEIRSDIPGFLSMGLGYQFTDKWRVNFGSRYMFIKGANFNGREANIDKNYYEVEFGTSYQVFNKFLLSTGYTYNKAGVAPQYHNDVDFWIPGHSFAFGGKLDFTKAISLDMGVMYTKNVGQNFTYTNHVYADGNALAGQPANYDNSYTMKFTKSSLIFALGLNIKIRNSKDKTPNLQEIVEPKNNGDLPYHYRG
ncbi:MAG: outer membrane protein transport protein [Chitinophagales bacterium]|nr:outer membrane protein transport protein [Chitinophagales bacterium]